MAKKETSIQVKASDPNKGFALSFTLLLAVLGFIGVLVGIFFFMRLIFGLMNFMPWLDYVFAVLTVCVPPTIFIVAYSIFFNRTRKYIIKPIRYVSLVIMAVAVVGWCYIMVHDLMHFFRNEKVTIETYLSYSKIILTGSIATIFILGLVQAFALPKEDDWMVKAAKKNIHIP